MIIPYGDGWIKFPDCVWEPTHIDHETHITYWRSRPVTSKDTASRKALATEQVKIDEPA